jgi:hypothetical protein
VVIPATLEEAADQLSGLGSLITKAKWERAAIVAAYVRLDEVNGRNARKAANGGSFETPVQFAERGILGLRSATSVRKYVQAWLDEHDGKYPSPGKVTIPIREFPAMRTGTDGFDSLPGAVTTIEQMVEKHGVDTVAQVILATPKVADDVYRKVIDRRVAEVDRGPGGESIPDIVDRQQKDWERRNLSPRRTRLAELQELSFQVGTALARAHALVMESDLSTEEQDTYRRLLDRCATFVTQGMEAT